MVKPTGADGSYYMILIFCRTRGVIKVFYNTKNHIFISADSSFRDSVSLASAVFVKKMLFTLFV